jgi:magnesium-transporting ATPase (P-type)
MNIVKIMRIIVAVVGVVAAIFLVRIIGVGDDEIKAGQDSVVQPLMYMAYVALVLTIVAVLLFTVINLVKKPALLKQTLINVGLFAVVVVIGYVMSSGTDLDLKPFISKGLDVTENTSKYVGMGLITFYILTAIAILAMIYTGVKKLFNN